MTIQLAYMGVFGESTTNVAIWRGKVSIKNKTIFYGIFHNGETRARQKIQMFSDQFEA